MTDSEKDYRAVYLDTQAAAAYSGLPDSAIRALYKDGEIPAARIRGRFMVRRSDLDQYIESRMQVAA